MKKVSLILVGSLVISIALAGCGSKNTNSTSTNNSNNVAQSSGNSTQQAGNTTQNINKSKTSDIIEVSYHIEDNSTNLSKDGISFSKNNITMKAGQKIILSPDEYTRKGQYRIVDDINSNNILEVNTSYLPNTNISIFTYIAKTPGQTQLEYYVAHDATLKATLVVTVVGQSTSSQTSTTTQKKLQPIDAAKAAANVNDQYSPYFLTYDYDENNYIVVAYNLQNIHGEYSACTGTYFVNKSTGQVQEVEPDQIKKNDWGKELVVYTKVMK